MKKILLFSFLSFLFSFFNLNTFANKKITVVDVVGSEILLIVDLDENMHFKEYFTIQYKNIDFSMFSKFKYFELLSYQKSELKINSGSANFTFRLSGSSSSFDFISYGIAHHTNNDDFVLQKIKFGNSSGVIGKPVKNSKREKINCTSGGPGAVSCGTGSSEGLVASVSTECNVTCGGGYYACCDDGLGKCGCVLNGLTINSGSTIDSPIFYY
jgi:hypothetical protein